MSPVLNDWAIVHPTISVGYFGSLYKKCISEICALELNYSSQNQGYRSPREWKCTILFYDSLLVSGNQS